MPAQPTINDEELMLDYAQGSEAAFEQLYSRYHRRIFGYLRRRLKDPAACEEIFQLTFQKLHENRHRYRAKFFFSHWIYVITRSVWLDYLRKIKRDHLEFVEIIPEPLSQTEGSETYHPSEMNETVVNHVSSLPPDQRKAFELRVLDELSYREIAARLSLTESNARQLVSRAIRKLRGLQTRAPQGVRR